jgi:hypothetical protein
VIRERRRRRAPSTGGQPAASAHVDFQKQSNRTTQRTLGERGGVVRVLGDDLVRVELREPAVVLPLARGALSCCVALVDRDRERQQQRQQGGRRGSGCGSHRWWSSSPARARAVPLAGGRDHHVLVLPFFLFSLSLRANVGSSRELYDNSARREKNNCVM